MENLNPWITSYGRKPTIAPIDYVEVRASGTETALAGPAGVINWPSVAQYRRLNSVEQEIVEARHDDQ